MIAAPLALYAAGPDPADRSIRQFLAHDDPQQHPYRAARRLEAENGDRKAWLEALTEYSDTSGFSYRITGEGGSNYLVHKVLRPVLEGERQAIEDVAASKNILSRSIP